MNSRNETLFIGGFESNNVNTSKERVKCTVVDVKLILTTGTSKTSITNRVEGHLK